jgi:cAMP phosphodiesterase
MFGLDSIKSWLISVMLKDQVYSGTRLPTPSRRKQKNRLPEQPQVIDRFQERFMNDPEWQEFDQKVRRAVSNIRAGVPPEEAD